MDSHWRTTAAGVAAGMAGIAAALAQYFTSGNLDSRTLLDGVMAVAVAFGLFKAADAAVAKKE